MLFDPITISGMALKNRIVRAATAENMATTEGLPTDALWRLYERLARGGAGLIITGLAYVNQAGRSTPLLSGAYTDAIIPGWRDITDAVHEHEAKIALQIAHCGRQTVPFEGAPRSVASSAIPEFLYLRRPRAMTEHEIWQTIDDFGNAAGRAKEAGFDAVELHGAHGYLISGFLSPLTNRRRDDWGGSPERRSRFLFEVYRAVRDAVGPDFPILCKLNMDDFAPGGLKPGESFPVARRLAEMGLDALEVSGGMAETWFSSTVLGDTPVDIITRGRSPIARLLLGAAMGLQKRRTRFREAYFLPFAEKLKPTLSIPLILVGGIRRADSAEQILASGQADLISLGRPLIREPDLPNKWLADGSVVAMCQSCNRCICELAHGNKLMCYAKDR